MGNKDKDEEQEAWQEKMGKMHDMNKGMFLMQHGWRAGFGRRGWLRPGIIKMLQEKPMNGIDIMDKMQEMSHGWYRPSPGSVYPLLEQLESEGLIKKNKDMKYELSESFRKQSMPLGQTENALRDMEGTISYLEELQKTDKAKFAKYKSRLEDIKQRLSKLK